MIVLLSQLKRRYGALQISFSTSPFARNTHWKQTVFYLPDTLTVCAGEEVCGTISCKPNEKNHRDLDFEISYEFSGRLGSSSAKALQYRMR